MKPAENLEYYIKNHKQEVIEKGFDIFSEYKDEIIILGKKKKLYSIDVPSQSGIGNYLVSLNFLADNVQDRCECKAFEKYDQCKHTVAAALALLVDEFGFTEDDLENLIEPEDIEIMEEEVAFIQAKSVSKNNAAKAPVTKKQSNESDKKDIIAAPENKVWEKFTKKGNFSLGDLNIYCGYYWPRFGDLNKVVQTSFDQNELHWKFSFKDKKQEATPEFKYDAHDTFYYRCTCNNTSHYPMCIHVRMSFDKLLHVNDPGYFLRFKD
jgi:hypothetical protein